MTVRRKLWLIGVSHHSAPVELRERLAFEDEAAGAASRKLLALPGLEECALVSTCNRVELVACADPAKIDARAVGDLLAGERGVPAAELRSYLYVHEDCSAVQHLFRVASSLDSMVVGEPQILGQLKSSYDAAVEAGTAGTILHRMFHKSFSVAKRVRSETGIGGRNVSVSSVAVDLAAQIFESLGEKTALVIGAGKMAELTARHFRSRGIGGLIFANRTFDRAVELARELHGTTVPFDDLARYLPLADVVIGSTAANEVLLTADAVGEALRERSYRPTFLIDLGVPRNFDPRINDLRNVYLYDIDDLRGVIGENRGERQREALRAEEIVRSEVDSFWRWFQNLDVIPTIVGLRGKADGICRRELERTLGSLRQLGDEERKSIEAMAQAIVNKILHEPISRLKRIDDARAQDVQVARRLFGLDDDE
ncbi:MAG: glutamyl-tRNA reductase [Deltaproteobacteria bacterium]|nr:glutamyl-tRNA reductase [Deltaproteobacteria bacterium]